MYLVTIYIKVSTDIKDYLKGSVLGQENSIIRQKCFKLNCTSIFSLSEVVENVRRQ
jgi:hypothetical protein